MDKQMSLWGSPKQLAQANQNPAPASNSTATQYQNALNQAQWGNTVPVTTTGGLSGILGTATPSWNTGINYPYPYPQPYPTVSVPIYNYDSKEGILLTDKEGKQHFVPIRDIAQQIGLEW